MRARDLGSIRKHFLGSFDPLTDPLAYESRFSSSIQYLDKVRNKLSKCYIEIKSLYLTIQGTHSACVSFSVTKISF